MKKVIIAQIFIASFLFMIGPAFSQKYIADYEVAKEEVIRSIPVEYINKARTELVIAYQHTSHGTHVSRGVFGLQDYKSGDEMKIIDYEKDTYLYSVTYSGTACFCTGYAHH